MRPDKAVNGAKPRALGLLDDFRLEVVIAQEVAHVVNLDGRLTLKTFAFFGSIAVVAGLLAVRWAPL